MRYRIETNDERLPVSAWQPTEESATALCAQMNVGAYQRGEGGLYGVYDNEGRRVP